MGIRIASTRSELYRHPTHHTSSPLDYVRLLRVVVTQGHMSSARRPQGQNPQLFTSHLAIRLDLSYHSFNF